jgi:hypothetical protein
VTGPWCANRQSVNYTCLRQVHWSEKLWGAASHALIAVAQLRNLPHGSHRALKNAAQLLADETGDVALLLGFVSSEKFHANFYFMEDFELDADRPTVKEFVDRLMALSA